MDIYTILQKKKYVLSFIVVVSLVIRVLFFGLYQQYGNGAWLAFDSEQYNAVALQVAQGNGINNTDGSPNFYRLPLYPLFLAAGYKIFGTDITKILWFQVALASLIPIAIYFLACALQCSGTVATFAACAAAVHPGFIMYAGTVSTESLFLFFFLLFLIAFFRGIERKRLWMLLIAGILLGIASLIRAVGHYALVLALWYIFCIRCWEYRQAYVYDKSRYPECAKAQGLSIKKAWIYRLLGMMTCWMRNIYLKSISILFAGWFVIVTPWLIRNFILTGALFFHTLHGLHFLQYSAVYVVQALEQCDYFAAKKKVFTAWDAKIAEAQEHQTLPLNEYQRYAIAERLAYSYIFSHPFISLKYAIVQMARTCCTLYSTLLLYVPLGTVYGDASLWFKAKLYLVPTVIKRGLQVLVYWELIFFVIMILGWIILLFKTFRDKALQILLLKIVPFMCLLIGLTVAYGCARLRFAVEPFIIIGAVHGLFGKHI